MGLLKKARLKGWKTPRLSCPNCRVRQKPSLVQLDLFWDSSNRGGFEYDHGKGRMFYVSQKEDVAACE